MAINLATDSIIPSIVIHFINNTLSVSLLFISAEIGKYIFCIVVLILAVISLVILIKRRKEYERPLSLITEKGEGAKITMEMILFAAFTLAVAVLNLL